MAASVALIWLLMSYGVPGRVQAQSNRASVQIPASNTFTSQPAKPSLVSSLSSGVKRGWDGVTGALTPETPVTPAPDPTSLTSPGRPSPRLHVEVARLNEHAGRLDEAERHYLEALRLDRNDLSAMLNYARLKDRQGKAAEALDLYRRAVEAHPREAPAYNYLGLHYDRRKMPDAAAAAFTQAVQLKPDEPLYRNNLAHVLVQLGQLSAAFEHLHGVHGESVAYYNLGYLLHQRGQREAAVQHLAAALRRNPNLTPARQLLAELAPDAVVPSAVHRTGSHVSSTPRPAAGFHQPAERRPVNESLGPAQYGHRRPDAPGAPHGYLQSPHPSPHGAPPGASQQPVAQGHTRTSDAPRPPVEDRPPQLGPARPHVPPEPPPTMPRQPGPRDAFPQEPSYIEPPGRSGVPLPRQSSTSLQQPQGIVHDEVRLNAPHIQLTGATLAITQADE